MCREGFGVLKVIQEEGKIKAEDKAWLASRGCDVHCLGSLLGLWVHRPAAAGGPVGGLCCRQKLFGGP